MNFNISEHLPEDFAPESRVWIYQSSRIFFMAEALEIETILQTFVNDWKSHGTPVKGYANLFFGRFIIFIADENATGVSGCSTDSSVKIIKDIEKKYNVQLFDRQMLTFYIKEKVEIIPLSQLNYAINNNFISNETLYFDNTVLTKDALENRWITATKNTWLATKFSSLIQ